MGWRELEKPWHDTTVDYCDVCGNLLIRAYWEFRGADGKLLRACREDDEQLLARLDIARTAGAQERRVGDTHGR